MPESRTLTQVDRDIKLLISDRRRYLAQIEDHLRAVAELRKSYARAETRIDDYLEERLTLRRLPLK